ncbi:MAG: FN3 associated domain-containing protein [Verrucomicrobiota bacterium]
MASFFHQLQAEIASRLESDPFFSEAEIPCLWELKKDVDHEVEAAVSQIGAGVMVVTPTASVEDADLPGPWYGDIGVAIQCYSDPVIAPNAPRAMEIAEQVVALLHHWLPASLSVPLIATKPTIVPAEVDQGNGDGREVRFTCAGAKGIVIPQVAPPVVDPDTGTITCATPGAAIFYRVDGRRPNPRAGTLYLDPVTLESGSQLIARAYLAGFLDSDYATLNAP